MSAATGRSCAVAAVLLALTSSQTQRANGLAPSGFDRIRAIAQTEMGVGTITPSIAVAVARDGAVTWEEGFGLIDNSRTKATPDTLYATASVTKTVTATALMILQQRHRLDLDRSANSYLKGHQLRSPQWNANGVTVRQLATHTAGLTTYDTSEPITADEIFRRYGVVFWKPGDHFDYSNLGYGVLGQIVADVSGRSFQSFVRDEVLRPLGMMDSWAGAAPPSPAAVAPRFSSLLNDFTPPPSEPTLPGASVFYSSAHELVRFGMFHSKEHLPSQSAILSDASIDAMRAYSVTTGGIGHSVGWSVNENQHGYRTLVAQGGTFDSQAWLLLIPAERIVVVALANAGNVPLQRLIDEILADMLPHYRERLLADTAAAPASTPITDIAPFKGRWRGQINTYRGAIPISITVRDVNDVTVSTRTTEVKMTQIRASPEKFVGRANLDLGLSYPADARYELRFELVPVTGKLAGAAVTYALPGFDGPRYPFWTELHR